MKKLVPFLLVTGFSLFLSHAALSQEVATTTPNPTTETYTASDNDATTETEMPGSRINSRKLLTRKLIAGLTDEGTDENTPEGPDSAASEDTAGTDTGGSKGGDGLIAGDNTGTGGGVYAVQNPELRIMVFVESLSDEQASVLNRSLDNASKSGLYIEVNMDLLEQIVENDYNSRQIQVLTKAMEDEARFLALYEKTGNQNFLGKAESRKKKFLAQIDGLGDSMETTGMGRQGSEYMKSMVKEPAKTGAKESTKHAAK